MLNKILSKTSNKTFNEIWGDLKLLLVIIIAAVPIIAIIIGIKYDSDFIKLSKLTFSLILIQTGFMIALLNELYNVTKKQTPKRITNIQSSYEFWQSTEHRFLYLSVVNGVRFVELIRDNKIKIELIKLIVPSEEAIILYYKKDKVVNDKDNAIKMIEYSLKTVKSALDIMKDTCQISEYEIRRSSVFPLDFFAIFDSQACLTGKYFKDKFRKEGIGIRSRCWVEKDPVIIDIQTQYFENIWSELGE